VELVVGAESDLDQFRSRRDRYFGALVRLFDLRIAQDVTALLAVLTSKLLAALSSTAIMGLFISAEVNSAPDNLPTFRTLPQWLWTWQIHAARMFLNMRSPVATPVATASVLDVRTHSLTVQKGASPNVSSPDAGQKENNNS
jgi:hypothetical protein